MVQISTIFIEGCSGAIKLMVSKFFPLSTVIENKCIHGMN